MLPLTLLDRLIASRLVPLDAKLAAIEGWRRELATLRSLNPMQAQLYQRLTRARQKLVRLEASRESA
jgi:hypothetical protein